MANRERARKEANATFRQKRRLLWFVLKVLVPENNSALEVMDLSFLRREKHVRRYVKIGCKRVTEAICQLVA